jgi:hypothetical protein
VAPTPAPGYSAYPVGRVRRDGGAYDRSAWCDDANLPCRLVAYSPEVIGHACENYGKPKPVYTTIYVPGYDVTETETYTQPCKTDYVYPTPIYSPKPPVYETTPIYTPEPYESSYTPEPYEPSYTPEPYEPSYTPEPYEPSYTPDPD